MKKWKQAFIAAICVSIGSQLYVNAFTDGFIITLAVIILGIFLSQYGNQNPLGITMLTAVCSPLFRGIMLYFQLNDLALVLSMVAPDISFYVTYGLIYYFLCYRYKSSYTRFFLVIVMCDFFSNIVEMSFRLGIFGVDLSLSKKLILIAIARSALVLFVAVAINYYRAMLSKEEHEKRYKKLMVMASVFNSEVYFMNKNMIEIEDVMKKAFTLYRSLDSASYPKEFHQLALDIAKDVHEIKKDYIRVIKGLQDNFLSEISVSEMGIRDIVQILEADVKEQLRNSASSIFFTSSVKCDFTVKQHFSLMAVLRNLIINSVEAIGERRKGYIELLIDKNQKDGVPVFTFQVFDNGPGIKKNELGVIYDPGFSTKFDRNTGDISRGVGLTLVRTLIEETFCGTITVESSENSYTRFIIYIPCDEFRGEAI